MADIDYKQLISFKLMKEVMQEKKITSVELSKKCGCSADLISMIIKGKATPKTDLFVKFCYFLGEMPSKICEFKDITKKPWFEGRSYFYIPEQDAKGELTYRPLRRLLDAYIDEANATLADGAEKKTADTFYDMVTPNRRRNGNFDKSMKGMKMALEARGLTTGKKETRNRRDYSKGLPYKTRTKLRRDEPINLGTVYDMCKVLGCSPDWVVSYK